VPVGRAVALIRSVLEALAWAHAAGIVHRDLKPENVLVVSGPGGDATKVLDFGIARVMDAAGGQGKRTSTGMLLGTPGYMSPEQIARPHDVDARSDLFSVGVMLYELLTGGADPWPSTTMFEKIAHVLANDAIPIGKVAPGLAALDPFFRRALARDRSDRFASASEMAAALAIAAAPLGGHVAMAGPALAAPNATPATQHSEARPTDVPAPRPEVAPGQIKVVSMRRGPPAWAIVLGIGVLLVLVAIVAVVVHVAT
jgi:serine/threonine-protein kinase